MSPIVSRENVSKNEMKIDQFDQNETISHTKTRKLEKNWKRLEGNPLEIWEKRQIFEEFYEFF
jgi:hypothetical protein